MNIENMCENLKGNFYKKNFKTPLFLEEYYFERKDDAEKLAHALIYHDLSFSIFEKRRKGKTAFLTYDLSKILSNNGYVFYFSFMDEEGKVVPIEKFKKELFEFVYVTICGNKINFPLENKNNILIKDFAINFLGIKFTGINKYEDINFNDVQTSDIFKLMDNYSDKKIFLLLDEIQEVAKIENSIEFIKGLRTALDLRQKYINCVFTGSSYYGLENMFSNYSEPFFRFGANYKFSDLNKDFTDHMLKIFFNNLSKINKKNEYEKEMLKVFKSKDDFEIKIFNIFCETGKYPIIIKDLLIKLEMDLNFFDIDKHVSDNRLHRDLRTQKEYWDKLNNLEQVIIKTMIKERIKEKLTSEKFYSLVNNYLKNNTLSKNKISYILKKLMEKNVLFKNKQKWDFVDHTFEIYIEQNEL